MPIAPTPVKTPIQHTTSGLVDYLTVLDDGCTFTCGRKTFRIARSDTNYDAAYSLVLAAWSSSATLEIIYTEPLTPQVPSSQGATPMQSPAYDPTLNNPVEIKGQRPGK